MTDQIAVWKTEHRNFSCLLDLLDAQIRLFHRGERPDYDLMVDITDYLIHYSDRFHHPKEDVAIDRLIAKAPEAHELADRLKQEHKVIADSGALLLSSLHAVIGGAMMARAALEAPAATYVAYYRQHMSHEQAELFPRLERALDTPDWAAIEHALPSHPDPLFADRPEERYAALHGRIVKLTGCRLGRDAKEVAEAA